MPLPSPLPAYGSRYPLQLSTRVPLRFPLLSLMQYSPVRILSKASAKESSERRIVTAVGWGLIYRTNEFVPPVFTEELSMGLLLTIQKQSLDSMTARSFAPSSLTRKPMLRIPTHERKIVVPRNTTRILSKRE